jgi:hypothetical protein
VASRKKTGMPRRGDKVWVEDMPQPNGFVQFIDWEAREALIRFPSDPPRTPKTMFRDIPIEDFKGAFNSAFGGIWMFFR